MEDAGAKGLRSLAGSATVRSAELQGMISCFVVWCLQAEGAARLAEALRTMGNLQKELRGQRFAIVRRLVTPDGVDPAVEDASMAIVTANWSSGDVRVDEVVDRDPRFKSEILLLARMGGTEAYEYLVKGHPALSALSREVEVGLAAERWQTLFHFDTFVRQRLEPLVGRVANGQAALYQSDAAWRCIYWYLVGQY